MLPAVAETPGFEPSTPASEFIRLTEGIKKEEEIILPFEPEPEPYCSKGVAITVIVIGLLALIVAGVLMGVLVPGLSDRVVLIMTGSFGITGAALITSGCALILVKKNPEMYDHHVHTLNKVRNDCHQVKQALPLYKVYSIEDPQVPIDPKDINQRYQMLEHENKMLQLQLNGQPVPVEILAEAESIEDEHYSPRAEFRNMQIRQLKPVASAVELLSSNNKRGFKAVLLVVGVVALLALAAFITLFPSQLSVGSAKAIGAALGMVGGIFISLGMILKGGNKNEHKRLSEAFKKIMQKCAETITTLPNYAVYRLDGWRIFYSYVNNEFQNLEKVNKRLKEQLSRRKEASDEEEQKEGVAPPNLHQAP